MKMQRSSGDEKFVEGLRAIGARHPSRSDTPEITELVCERSTQTPSDACTPDARAADLETTVVAERSDRRLGERALARIGRSVSKAERAIRRCAFP
jgi:hypothetical protein